MAESSIISLKILNELNPVVQEIDDFRFYSGESRTIKCQVWHDGDDGAYIVPAGATATFVLKAKTGFDILKSTTIDAIDRSIVTATITSTDTSKMISGDLTLEVMDSGLKRIAKQGNLSKGVVLLS